VEHSHVVTVSALDVAAPVIQREGFVQVRLLARGLEGGREGAREGGREGGSEGGVKRGTALKRAVALSEHVREPLA